MKFKIIDIPRHLKSQELVALCINEKQYKLKNFNADRHSFYSKIPFKNFHQYLIPSLHQNAFEMYVGVVGFTIYTALPIIEEPPSSLYRKK